MAYLLLLQLHLFGAIVFIGAVAFEVLILGALHQCDKSTVARIERAVVRRAKRVMPWVVAGSTPAASCFSRFVVRVYAACTRNLVGYC